jgi:transcriptional regulator with XRE-family HTH domain
MMIQLQNKTGKLVRNLRKKAGLTQFDLAKKTGISFRTIQRIESGEISPRIDIFFSIIRNSDANAAQELVSLFSNDDLPHEGEAGLGKI